MKRLIVILLSSVLHFGVLWGQNADTLRTIEVEEIVVSAARSLRDIGVQKSIMSEAVLKENLAASMAEVLAQNSTIFIKSSGRATLSTASIRGTAPSHTSVSWNGIELGSPMLGMVDFSMIPSYFVDGSEVYHGATSVNAASGGLGGAVVLTTSEEQQQGLNFQLVQSLASFSTHDEYLRIGYSTPKWSSSTRLLNSGSRNDFPYVNYDKVGHPTERNKNCGYHDQHILQEFFLRGARGGKWAIKCWGTNSSRGIPKLSVDYRDDGLTKSWQDEQSLRSVVEWRRSFGGLRLHSAAGYNLNNIHYIYQFSKGGGEVQRGVNSQSTTQHLFATSKAEWSIGNTLMLAANLKASAYDVESRDVAPLVPVGYEATRRELTSFVSARWKPAEWLGLAGNLREEWRDGGWSPIIPALFMDITLSERYGIIVSGSVARNYHHPTLNDLYFVPGGNPNLKPEVGTTYDLGIEGRLKRPQWEIGGKLAIYRSDITNWILWTPTVKGFWSPENLSAVRSSGVEARANAKWRAGRECTIGLNAIFAYTSSVDNSIGGAHFGEQLPYIPLYSASAGVRVGWREWDFDYKWRYYSERNTTYSGSSFGSSVVPAYQLSDVALSREVKIKNRVRFRVRLEVLNLFGEVYQSVLSKPMPSRSYAISVECKF